MRDLREVAGRENVYYLVTDALYVNQQGFDNLNAAGYVQDRTLGKLTVKHVGRSAEFECLHHLRVGDMVAVVLSRVTPSKSERTSGKNSTFQGLRNIIAGRRESRRVVNKTTGEITFVEEVLPPLPGVLTFPMVKTFSKQYNRGYKQPNGWVAPLVLSMAENENASPSQTNPVDDIPATGSDTPRKNGSRRRNRSKASRRALHPRGSGGRRNGMRRLDRPAGRRQSSRKSDD